MNFKLFIALFALVGAAVAVPTTRLPNNIQNEHSKCSSIDNLHNEIGKTYSYTYSAKSDIELNNGEKTQVIIKSVVDVTPIGGCEHLMHMRQVRVQGPAEADQLARRLEQAPVWFRQDARRIREIGHSAEEDHLTLNLKRAVLSAMQVSSLDNVKMVEKDIFGRCETEYQKTSGSKSEVYLTKQKTLESCSHRRHPLASLLWKNEKTNDNLNCKLTVSLSDRVIRKLHCVERAQVTPLIGSTLGTQVSNEIELQHKETRENVERVPTDLENYVRDSIAFSKPTDLYKQYAKPEQQQKLQRQAESLLQQIRENKAQSESIEQINQLAEAINKMSAVTLQNVADKLFQKTSSSTEQRMQQLFTDLVAQSGNQETLKFMFEQALNNESSLRRNYWLLHLSEIREASTHSVQQLIKILRQREQALPRQALLAIARIIGNSNEVRSKPEVYATAVEAIAEWMHERTASKRMRIAAAQALKSVELTHSAQQQLIKIAAATSEDIELRVAAVRTLSTHQELTSKVAEQLYQLFDRSAEPAEIRIHAFRALIQDDQQVEKVLRRLAKESNEQVGFYAGSFLKNMKHNHRSIKSTNVQQQIERFEIPQHLISSGDKKTARHFNMRQNVQFLDADLELDSDLIYDEQQRLSAVRAKVHMDKHYQQGDHMEVYVRQHGFERVISAIESQWDQVSFQKMIAQCYAMIRNGGRTQQIVDQVNTMLREFAFNQQMKGSFELTINGAVLVSVATEDLAELATEPKKNMHEMLQQMTSQIAFHNFLFRKQQVLPTVAGIALETTQQSTWMSSFQAGQGKFNPSIAFQLQLSTGFRLPYAQPRLTYKMQVNSSPSFRVQTQKENGQITKVGVYMEQQRMTLWRFQSDVEFTNVEGKTKQVEQAVQQGKYCLTSLRSVIGATVCMETKQGKKISAVADMHVYIEKENVEMKGWELRLKSPSSIPFSWYKVQPFVYMVSVNTPGSRVAREHTFEVRFENTNEVKQIKLNLVSPKRRFTVEASLENKNEKKALQIQFALNQQKSLIHASLLRAESGKYIPTVRVQLPNQRPYTYTGELIVKQSGKDQLQIKLVDEQTKESVFNFNFMRAGRLFARSENEQYRVSVDALLQNPHQGQQFRYISHLSLNNKEVEYEQQYSQRWSANAVPEVYRLAGKILRNGNLFIENSKYTAHFEYQLPQYAGELHWNMNGQLLKTNKPHLESELSVFTSQAGRKEKLRILHIQKVLKVQEVREDYEINWNLIAQSESLNINHELQLQSVVSRQFKKQPKMIVNWTFAKRGQQPMLKAETAFEMNTPAYPVLHVSAKLTTKFASAENIYALNHEIQRNQEGKLQAKTKLQWSPKHFIELQNSLHMQRQSEHNHYEIEGQIRVPHHNIEWNFQNVLRISKNFELKSIVRDRTQVRSEVRIFLSREMTSSIYVDNRLINFKAEASNFRQQGEKLIHLHFNGKTFGFIHSSRFEIKSDRSMELVSKTVRDSNTLVDVRGKLNNSLIAFSVEAGSQKATANFDRKSNKLVVLVKHDQLLNKQRHQIQISANVQRRVVNVDAKIDVDQALWGKLLAVYNMDKEAQLKMSFGELNAKLESTQAQKQWTGFLKYAPWNLQQTMQVSYKPETKTVEAHLKATTSKNPIDFRAKISATQETKITFDNVHFKVTFDGNWNQKNGKLNFVDNQHKIQHKTNLKYDQAERALHFDSVQTQSGVEQYNHNGKFILQWNKQSQAKFQINRYQVQLTSKLPEKFEWTVIDKKTNEKKQWTSFQMQQTREQIPSFEIRSETLYNQKKHQYVVKFSPKQVQIKIDHEHQHSINFNAERVAADAFTMWIEKVDQIGYKRIERAEITYKHNEKFEFNVQTGANGKQMHKPIQVQVQRQQTGAWNTEMKLGSVTFDFKLQNTREQRGFVAKIQYPLMKNRYESELQALYTYEKAETRIVFKQQVNQQNQYDVLAVARWEGLDVVFNDNETRFEMHMKFDKQGRVQATLNNQRLQWNVKLNSKWEQERSYDVQVFDFDFDAKHHQKTIASAQMQFNRKQQQQPAFAKLSLYENELKLDFDRVLKLKINVPSKVIVVSAEMQPWETLEAQVFVKGTSVVSFQLNKLSLHMQAMDHELSVKLQHNGEQRSLEASYQILHLKHRTEFTINYQPQEQKFIFNLISKQKDQTLVNWDSVVVYKWAQFETNFKIHVLNHWFAFELKNEQYLRISHEYLHQGTKTVTFRFEAVRQQNRPEQWIVKMILLNQHKLEGEIIYSNKNNTVQIRYDYIPRQYNVRVNLVYKQQEQQVQYLIGAYQQENQLYVVSGNWQRMQKQQMKVVFGRYEAQVKMQQPFDLTAFFSVEQKKQVELSFQKQSSRLNAALIVAYFDVNGKWTLKSESKETQMEIQVQSEKYQLKHRTQMTTTTQKPFELTTSTESQQVNYNIEINSWENKKSDSKIVYRIFGYHGNFKFDFQPNEQVVFEHECHQPNAQSYELKAKVQLNQTPLKGELFFKRNNQQTNVYMKVQKQTVEGERMHQIVISAVQQGQQKPVFHFETSFSADLMREKRAGRLDGRLISKIQAFNKRMELNYVWKNTRAEFTHELKAEYEQYVYGYTVTIGQTNGKMIITLPKEHKIVIEFNQQKQGEWEMIVFPNFVHQSSNKYTTVFRYNIEQHGQKWQVYSFVTLKHSSSLRPITLELNYAYNPVSETPVEFKFTVDANKTAPVFVFFKVQNNKQGLQQVFFQLHQSETKHLHIVGEWMLTMPLHQQALYWQYNNNYQRTVEGGYLFKGNFEQHKYELNLKSINVFHIEYQQTSEVEYVLTVLPNQGNVQRVVLSLNLARGESRLQVQDRQNKKWEFNGQAAYDKVNGLHMKVYEQGTQRTAAQLLVKRDDASYLIVVADIQKVLFNVVKPSAHFQQALIEYSQTHLHMQQIVHSIVEDIFTGHFAAFWTQVARDIYFVLVDTLSEETVMHIIHKKPVTQEDFVKAVYQIWNYYQNKAANWFWNDVLPHILPNHVQVALKNWWKNTIVWTQQTSRQVARFVSEYSQEAARHFGQWFESFRQSYEHFRRLNPVEQLRHLFAQLDNFVAQVQRFFDHYVVDLITIMIEHSHGFAKQWLIRARDFIPRFSKHITSFNLAEMFVNVAEVLFGQQPWWNGNRLQWQPEQGHMEVRVFFPSSIVHHFE